MKQAGIIIALLGAAAFIFSFFFDNIAIGKISLQAAGAWVYALGLYLFVAYSSLKHKNSLNAIMLTVVYATLLAYSLVTIIDGDSNVPLLALSAILLSANTLLIVLRRK